MDRTVDIHYHSMSRYIFVGAKGASCFYVVVESRNDTNIHPVALFLVFMQEAGR